MSFEGIHHITAITGDAQRNVDFYAGVLGLRMVKKTVNYDAPDVYHLYYGDEHGSPGSIMTFFEFPGAAPGRAGAGMIHTVSWRGGGGGGRDFLAPRRAGGRRWAARLEDAGRPVERTDGVLRSSDPEDLGIELLVGDSSAGAPDSSAAVAADVPAEHALQGFAGVRAYAIDRSRSARLLDRLGFVDA